ncbi:MAG: hypothetical protein MJK18_00060, partial [Bdellovibrionales bacterium]|nr:hypothetical protein [Bdellovibrionales bacterium]
MNVFQNLTIGLLSFFFAATAFGSYDKPTNLYELKKALKLEINKDNIDIEKKMKIKNLKLETDFISFQLNHQPIKIQWDLV